MHVAKQGGSPTHRSRKLRQRVYQMLNDGWTPAAIRHEIVTDDQCTESEKRSILRELNMEEYQWN